MDMGRFVHGSTNEGGDDLSFSVGDEEGGVGVIVNETRRRRRRDREGGGFSGDLLLDTSNFHLSQSALEAGSVELGGEPSEMEAVLSVGGVGCAEGADCDGGELGRGDLGSERVDDGDRGTGREGCVWELASGAEGFDVLFGDFGPKNRSRCPEGNLKWLWAWPTQRRRGVASRGVRVSRYEGSLADNVVGDPDDGFSLRGSGEG